MQKKIPLTRNIPHVCNRLFAYIIVAFILTIFTLFSSSALIYGNDEKSFVPWDYNRLNPQNENITIQRADTTLGGSILIKAVQFYQKYISPVIGARCPMNPSCSAYSIQAINKHGFFIGIMMTADRLIHEGDEIQYATAIIQGDRVTFLDPVDNNDFWFDKDKRN